MKMFCSLTHTTPSMYAYIQLYTYMYMYMYMCIYSVRTLYIVLCNILYNVHVHDMIVHV